MEKAHALPLIAESDLAIGAAIVTGRLGEQALRMRSAEAGQFDGVNDRASVPPGDGGNHLWFEVVGVGEKVQHVRMQVQTAAQGGEVVRGAGGFECQQKRN